MIYEKDLNSSAISHIKYNTETEILSITFTSGNTVYDYPGVPHHEVKSLTAAESVGKYFATHIRKYAVK